MSVMQNTPLVRAQLAELFGGSCQQPAAVVDMFGPQPQASSDAALVNHAPPSSSTTEITPPLNMISAGQPQTLHFVYDHYLDPARFAKNFPGSLWVGVAFLTDFTWHLTMNGEANIRQAFKSGNPAGDRPSHVFGHVFAIHGSTDEAIRQRMRRSHARLNVDVQLIRVNTNATGIRALTTADAMRDGTVSVITYADVRHTQDCTQAVLSARPIRLSAWSKGLQCLHRAGASQRFLSDVKRSLLGRKGIEEPTLGYVAQQFEPPIPKHL